MGACFDWFAVQTNDSKEAIQKCEDYIDQCKYDYGHAGYTGTMAEADGVVLTDENFNDKDEAVNWLDRNAEKWGPALGVKLKDNDKDYYVFGACCSS